MIISNGTNLSMVVLHCRMSRAARLMLVSSATNQFSTRFITVWGCFVAILRIREDNRWEFTHCGRNCKSRLNVSAIGNSRVNGSGERVKAEGQLS